MDIEIIDKPLSLTIHGFSGTAINQNYTGMAFQLMDKMWKVVRTTEQKNKGLNVIVYESQEKVFAGVELDEPIKSGTGLELKIIQLKKYAYYKHIGPYHLIKLMGQSMKKELINRGLELSDTYIEIYGHWNSDETKLETELFFSLE